MKQILISCLALTLVLASKEHHNVLQAYDPYQGHQLGLIDLGEHFEFAHGHNGYSNGNFGQFQGLKLDENWHFGYGQPLVQTLGDSISHGFDQTLVAPEIPNFDHEIKGSIAAPIFGDDFKTSIENNHIASINTKLPVPKYTKSPSNYEVDEPADPIDAANTANAVLPPKPFNNPFQPPQTGLPAIQPPTNDNIFKPAAVGSGTLGVVNLGNGQFALGSGSLGYIDQQPQQQLQQQPQQPQTQPETRTSPQTFQQPNQTLQAQQIVQQQQQLQQQQQQQGFQQFGVQDPSFQGIQQQLQQQLDKSQPPLPQLDLSQLGGYQSQLVGQQIQLQPQQAQASVGSANSGGLQVIAPPSLGSAQQQQQQQQFFNAGDSVQQSLGAFGAGAPYAGDFNSLQFA